MNLVILIVKYNEISKNETKKEVLNHKSQFLAIRFACMCKKVFAEFNFSFRFFVIDQFATFNMQKEIDCLFVCTRAK